MEVSVFKGAKDTAPQNIAVSWEDVCALASDLMAVEFARSNKTAHHAMIFGRCEGRRSNANVRFLSGLCADFDIGPDDPRYLSFQDRCDQLEAAGLKFIAYTTTKNSAGHNKYRLIMPYGRDVEPERCTAAWHASNAKLDGAIDASTKDAARLSFMPARWTENPFWDESKAMTVTLVDPFNAMRVSPDDRVAKLKAWAVQQANGDDEFAKRLDRAYPPNEVNEAAGLPLMDWEAINSVDVLALWRSVDWRAAHPLQSDPVIPTMRPASTCMATLASTW